MAIRDFIATETNTKNTNKRQKPINSLFVFSCNSSPHVSGTCGSSIIVTQLFLAKDQQFFDHNPHPPEDTLIPSDLPNLPDPHHNTHTSSTYP